MIYLDAEHPELQFAWATFPDPLEKNNGEVWQYMGTSQREGIWTHTFRHRCHPTTNTPLYQHIPASPGFAA